MSRFNATNVSRTAQPDTTNLAGGQAFTQSPKLRLASALLTSFCKDTYYQSAQDNVSYIADLIAQQEDKLFAAKAAIYTRKQNGLRSVSHVAAGEIAQHVKGETWTKNFYKMVVQRPDDVTEILSYFTSKYGQRASKTPNKKGKVHSFEKIPNSLKRGLALALGTFDGYQLAKYKGEGKSISLIDAVNLCHPKYNEHLTALMKGTLKPAETWETKLVQAGQKATSQAQKDELKKEAWLDLVNANKLGYFAALRNLRNIADQAPEAMPKVLALLSNENAVKKSMVIPFQFVTAMEAIAGTSADTNAVKKALNAAMEHSLANVPSFDDETLIAVDVSGSMGGRPVKIAALFAAVLYKANNADVMLFDTSIRHMNLNPGDSLSTIASQIERAATGGGTSFHLIFEGAKKKYGRIIVLSDMQAWVTSGRPGGCYSSLPNEAHKAYKKKFSCNPKIYSFDLNGAGSMQFPEENVYALAGFSDSVLGLMKNLEQNPQELVDTIEKVTF
jgi:hypothetical protein